MKLGGSGALGNGETQRTVSGPLGEKTITSRREIGETEFATVVGIGGGDLAIDAFPAQPLGANGADLGVRQWLAIGIHHSPADGSDRDGPQFEVARLAAWNQ